MKGSIRMKKNGKLIALITGASKKMMTDKERKFRSKLFQSDIKIYADGVSEEYIQKCIKFFDSITGQQIAERSREDFERLSEVSDLSKLEDAAKGDGILDLITLKVMHIDSDDGKDPSEIRFIVEGSAPWCDGYEIIVYDNRILHIGEYSGDYEQWRNGE